MNCIYAVVVINYKENRNQRTNTRTWFWFDTFEKAEQAILDNVFDMFEYYYSYAVVEEVPMGSVFVKVKQWYKATYADGKPPIVSTCEKPDWADVDDHWSFG